MSGQAVRGIDRRGLDGGFAAEETRKSALILEARLLREQLQEEGAADKLAEAAQIEERLADRCVEGGLTGKSFVHRFSAASCWAQAGNFYRATALCREMLGHPDLPERLRSRIRQYERTISDRRARWYQELSLQTAAAEG